jgi:tRNA1(Val) A37 N6-methylase TrmN6
LSNLFYQPENGYRYNSDTLFLYDFISKINPQGSLLDIGSGSGILGILLSKDFPNIELFSIEKQLSFQKLTLKNSKINGVKNINFTGDFLEYSFDRKFDFIVSNPPFYSSKVVQSENESLNIARYNSHLPIDKFFRKVYLSLNPRGKFIFCYDAKQTPEIFLELEKNRLRAERVRFLYPAKNKSASLILIEARRDSKSATIFEEPLYNFTDEVNEIYKRSNSYSIKADISEME